jgi:hypothetical protein
MMKFTSLKAVGTMTSAVGEMTIDDAWEYIKTAVLAGWSKTTRRLRAGVAILIFMYAFLRPQNTQGTH